MLKTLIKKQYMELFRTYFVNAKTGEPRTRGKVILLFVGFAVLMVVACAAFFLVAAGLGAGLLDVGADWLYFALMGMLAIMFGTFGSVFNTYASLYRAKDNDMLISMPIPPGKILFSRIAGVLGLSLLYSALVWIPAIIFYWIAGTPTVLAVVFEILLIFVIAALVSVLTCALGWVVALIAAKLKNRSFVIVLITLVFLGLYYFVCFRMSEIMTSLVANADKIGTTVRNWFNIFYQLGLAATGKVVPMLIFTGIAGVLSAVCYTVLSKSFIRIATTKVSAEKTVYVEKTARQQGARKALFIRELKRFTSNPTYMLNCGLGIAFMVAAAVLIAINADDVVPLLDMLSAEMPVIREYLPIGAAAIFGLIGGLDLISTPSVSLEGKNLWILRSLPVPTRSILGAKLNLHMAINGIPMVLSLIVVCIVLKTGPLGILIAVVLATLINLFIGAGGLMLGTVRANLIWTSEMQPIKSSTNILIMMLLGWVVSGAVGGLFFLVAGKMSPGTYAAICIAVLAVIDALIVKWLFSTGVKKFEEL